MVYFESVIRNEYAEKEACKILRENYVETCAISYFYLATTLKHTQKTVQNYINNSSPY